MIGYPSHLAEDRLYDAYFAARVGETVAPPVVEHLTDCDACRSRFAALEKTLDAVRAEGDAEVDELFPAERLHHQRTQILQRLEQLNRSARVISFPGQAGTSSADLARRFAPRWMAGSAAAGLFVGVALGGWLVGARDRAQSERQIPFTEPAASSPATAPVLAAAPPAVPNNTDDEAFLRQLEMALGQPGTRELQAFDAFTPHIREIQTRLR